MTFRIYFIFPLLFILFPSTAQNNEADFQVLEESSLLWKIEKQGSKSASYLFGTMHLIEKEYFYFPEKLEKLLKRSDVLVMELNGLPSQSEALELVTLKEGSFFDFFTKEQTDSILIWAKDALKLDEKSFRASMSKFKPFTVVQLATQMHFMGQTASYEMKLEELATMHKIETIGLETVAQQMSFFDQLSKEQQSEMVMEGIRNPKNSLNETKRIQNIYLSQNIDSLYLVIQASESVLSDEMDKFLDKRNQNWVPQIAQIIAEKSAFIAVGAGHLGGPNGLIRLLRKKGYTLTPIQL